MAKLQLFLLAPFQHLKPKGEDVRLQFVLCYSQGVESGGLCQNKTQRRHPRCYFVNQIVLHSLRMPIQTTTCVCLCVCGLS